MLSPDRSLYWLAVKALHRNRSYFAKILKQPSLSPTEKSLLLGRSLVVDHLWSEAVDVLSRTSSGEAFFQAEREYLLSEALNRLGRFSESLQAARRAVPLYQSCGDSSGAFQGLISVAVNLHVHGMLRESLTLLSDLQSLELSPLQRHMIFREQCYCELKLGTLSRVNALDRLNREKVAFPSRHRQVTDHAIGYILMSHGLLQESLKQFENCLERYPSLSRATATFWARLLSSALKGRNLPRPNSPLRKAPAYLVRYECVRELQAGDIDRARGRWERIQAWLPELFGEPFQFRQDWVAKTAFGILIARYRPNQVAVATIESTDIEYSQLTLEERLIYVLRKAGTPIPKDRLIELVYGEPYEISADARFYKLIERTKKKFPDTKIVSQLRAYRIL